MLKSFRITMMTLALAAVIAVAGYADDLTGDAAEARALYVLDDTSRQPETGWLAVEEAVEEFHIATQPELVAADPSTLLLDIPHGPQLEAVRTRFVDYGPEWKSWFGTLRPAGSKEDGEGFVYLGYHGDRISGIIHYDGWRYRITGGFGGPQRLVHQSDELADTPTCGLHDFEGVSPLPEGTDRADTDKLSAVTELEAGVAADKVLTRIDVMALYPKAYFSFPTSEVLLYDFVEDSIALANDAFANSNVNAYYNLVHVGPIVVGQPASNGLQGALDLLNAQPAEINTLRNAFGADFVTMFIPYIWTATNACGVANLPAFRTSDNHIAYVPGVSPLVPNALGTRLYSANRDGCGFGDYTLAHELGHNWGMWHNTTIPPSNPWYLLSATALGYNFTLSGQPKATVMGCNCTSGCTASTAAVCNRIPHFSDPAITYMGVATGTSATKNAQMARSRLASYPNFKPQSTNTPPVASFTATCNSMTRVCNFNASGTTDNGTITKYYWDFGDGTSATTTGATTSHTYSSNGSYWIHLLATDNGNQRDLSIDLVSF